MKKVFLGIIIIVILAVIIVGGFFAYQYFAKSKTLNTGLQVNSSEWKTYKNDIYGFEVQYPGNGFLTADNYRFAKDINDYVVEIRIPSPQSFLIEVSDGKNLADFSKTAIAASKSYIDNSVNNIMVDNVPAIEIIKKDQAGNEYRSVLFVRNGNGYYINMIGPGFENSEKMLTTFKFTK